MSALRWLLGAALALHAADARAACGAPKIVDLPITLGIETHGRQVGGMGIVTMQGAGETTSWSLTLLSPGGLALFTAHGAFDATAAEAPAVVETGLEAWRPWLEKLPLGRDLRTAFATWVDPTECAGGTTRTRPGAESMTWTRRWRGPGGAVKADITADRVLLHDRLRGYTLTLVAPGRELPHGGSPGGTPE